MAPWRRVVGILGGRRRVFHVQQPAFGDLVVGQRPLASGMRKSVLGTISSLVSAHGAEWTAASNAQLTLQPREGLGIQVILRTPTLGARRLVSALILMEVPRDAAEWRRLRSYCTSRNRAAICTAKFRYLFVPPDVLTEARSRIGGSSVRVLRLGAV